jgi:hypothetical protein
MQEAYKATMLACKSNQHDNEVTFEAGFDLSQELTNTFDD